MGTNVFVGVDVCKDNLDVAIGARKDIVTFTNDQKGVDALVKASKVKMLLLKVLKRCN